MRHAIIVANLAKGSGENPDEARTIVRYRMKTYSLTEWLLMFFKSEEKDFQEMVHQLMEQKTKGNTLEMRSARHILDLIPARYGGDSPFQEESV